MKQHTWNLRRIATTACLGVALLLIGCSKGGEFNTVKTTGKVVGPDGQPVKGGSITLRPVQESGAKATEAGKPASGSVDDTGNFTLSTYKDGDGAIPGKHEVSYSPPAPQATSSPEGGHQQAAPASPYAGMVPKEKQVEIKADGENNLTIELIKQ